MEFKITLYSLIYVLAGMTTLIPIWASWRLRRFPGVFSLFLMMLFMSAWELLCAVEMSVVMLEYKKIILVLEDAAFLTFDGMLYLFVLDYFSIGHWLTPIQRKWLWVFPIGLLVLDITNPWHGLFWSSYSPGPAGSSLLLLTPGPVFNILTICLYALNLAALVIVGYFAARKTSKVRIQARFIFIGILSAWTSQVVYILLPDQTIGLSILPIGFSICGMLISWVVFEDLLSQSHALAKDLQTSRDNISLLLIDQQQKVGGMYDLVYLNTSPKESVNLIKEALEKMRETTGCDSAAFFLQVETQYLLDVETGMDEPQKKLLAAWNMPEMSDKPEVVCWPDTQCNQLMPEELLRAGFQSAAAKWIQLSTGQRGSVFYFWQDQYPFKVDEITLMGAQVDVLGMIIENDHSRQISQEWATLSERQRLGRDLHDRISQDLFSLSIFAANSMHHATNGMNANLLEDLGTIKILSEQLLSEMRLLLFELQPQNITSSLRLEEAIQKRFAIVESHVNIQTSLVVSGGDTLPESIARVLYGVVVEALNNIVKYARAKSVLIRVETDGREVRLELRDDGVGFNQSTNSSRGLGLENMRQRVEQVYGRLVITSEIGKGTLIEAVLPISATAVPKQSEKFDKILYG